MWNGAEFAWQAIARQPWDCARECIRDPWPSPASLPLQAHGAPGCTQNHLGPSPFSPGKWIVRLIIFLRVNYWIPSFCEMESLLLTFINVFGTLFLLSFRITYRGLLVDISTWKDDRNHFMDSGTGRQHTTSCQPSPRPNWCSSSWLSTACSSSTSSSVLSSATSLRASGKITAGNRLALEEKLVYQRKIWGDRPGPKGITVIFVWVVLLCIWDNVIFDLLVVVGRRIVVDYFSPGIWRVLVRIDDTGQRWRLQVVRHLKVVARLMELGLVMEERIGLRGGGEGVALQVGVVCHHLVWLLLSWEVGLRGCYIFHLCNIIMEALCLLNIKVEQGQYKC